MRIVERFQRDAALRLAAGEIAWAKASQELQDNGVVAYLVGSMARRDVHGHSDLDVLVFDTAGLTQGKIRCLIEDCAGDIAVEVVFAEDLRDHTVQRMLSEANIVLPAKHCSEPR